MQFTFLLDDIGIPKDYRHMDGAGVHTFKLVDKAGRDTYVKFHWKTKQGEVNLLEDEAVTVGGGNHSHATQDLQDAIAAGDYPEWTLYIQVLLMADQCLGMRRHHMRGAALVEQPGSCACTSPLTDACGSLANICSML